MTLVNNPCLKVPSSDNKPPQVHPKQLASYAATLILKVGSLWGFISVA